MKGKFVVLFAVFSLVFSCAVCVSAETNPADKAFETIHIPYKEEGEYDWRKVVKARYADTKEPIPLSLTYDDSLYATVPKDRADDKIEAFVTECISFTDNDDSMYEFHVFEELSRSGIVRGNDKGEANPLNPITRAEATAMLMRFLGLENDADTAKRFSDVDESKWYCSVILSAYSHGLVKGDSEDTFSPQRNITREEFTVMASRAVKYALLGYPRNVVIKYADADKISSWAQESYDMLGSYVQSDYDYADEMQSEPIRILNPRTDATRYDVAYLLYNIERFCQVYPSSDAMKFGFDKNMPVIDGSTSTYPFTQAVYERLFSNGGNHPQKPSKHSKSHATYKRLINGEIDMSFASVYPASDILELARENGVEIELIPIAYDAMIFFTNAENSAKGLTKEEISNIYVNNAYKNWKEVSGPDALMYPYCRNNDSGSHAQMEKHFLNGKDIHPEVQKETSYTMSNVLTDVMSSKTENPIGYGLGYSIYYYFNNMDLFYNTKTELKLLEIDGVYPTDETIADGSYPLSNNTYIAILKSSPEDSPSRRMADYMLTPAGQDCVESAGFGKLIK